MRSSSRAFIAVVRSACSRSFSALMRSILRTPAADGAPRTYSAPAPCRLAHGRCAAAMPLAVARPRPGRVGYAAVVERNCVPAAPLRRARCSRPGSGPLRVLHLSDLHLTPGQQRLIDWVRSLGRPRARPGRQHRRLTSPTRTPCPPLLRRPGAAAGAARRVRLRLQRLLRARPKNPPRYLWRTGQNAPPARPDLPWDELRAGLAAAGWLDLNNARGRLKVGGPRRRAWPASTTRTSTATATTGSPAPADRRRRPPPRRHALPRAPRPRRASPPTATTCCSPATPTAASCCMPVYGALVTNCGIDRDRVKGLHRTGARPRPGCTSRPASAPRRTPRSASPAPRRPPCSPWSRRPARPVTSARGSARPR